MRPRLPINVHIRATSEGASSVTTIIFIISQLFLSFSHCCHYGNKYVSLGHNYSIFFVIMTTIFHHVTIILIIFVKNKWQKQIDVCVVIHSSNHAYCHLHHWGFEIQVPERNTRINSICDHQGVSSHCRAGHHSAFQTGVADVFTPSRAHG